MAGEVVEVNVKAVDELVARLTAVRGALQDRITDEHIVYKGAPAVLDFVEKICKRLKGIIMGAGSGPLQDLLVKDVAERIHGIDLGKHFSEENFEQKISQMNGYQSHLISPELAMRALIGDALKDVASVANWMTLQVRSFVSEAAREAAREVVEKDPYQRQELAAMVTTGIDQLLDEWEQEAEAVSEIFMDMEASHVSPVFFRRLAVKRAEMGQIASDAAVPAPSGRFAGVRAGGNKFIARFKRNKGGAGDGENGDAVAPPPPSKTPNNSGGGVLARRTRPPPATPRQAPNSLPPAPTNDAQLIQDLAKWTSRATWACISVELLGCLVKGQKTVSAGEQNGATHAPAGCTAAAERAWRRYVEAPTAKDPSVRLTRAKVRNGEAVYTLANGKFFKRSHGRLKQAWHERYFVLNAPSGDLYYWGSAPTEATMGEGTRVLVGKAGIEEPAPDERSNNAAAFVKLTNVVVMRKGDKTQSHDSLVLGFLDVAGRDFFVGQLQANQGSARAPAAPKDSVAAQKDAGEDEDDEDADDDGGDEDGEVAEDDGEVGSDEDGDEDEEEGEQELEDEAPGPAEALHYEVGGLGMGSHFFNADDIRGERAMRGSSTLLIPAEFRTAASPAETTRVEGREVLTWLASDIRMYCTIVMDTLAATLPKVTVMHLIERVVANELQYRLQKEALTWPVAEDEAVAVPLQDPKMFEKVLGDIEEQMVAARMAAGKASVAAAREGGDPTAATCGISVAALSLAGCARLLSAAQQPSPQSLLTDLYGSGLPDDMQAVADEAAERYEAVEARRVNGTRSNGHVDPLHADNSVMHGYVRDVPPDEQQVEEGGKRRSGFGGFGKRRGGKGAGTSSEPNLRSDAVTAPASATPARLTRSRSDLSETAPPRPSPPSAPAADPLAPTKAPQVASFGADPLAAPIKRVEPKSRAVDTVDDDEDTDDDDDDDDGSAPLRRSSLQHSRAGGAPSAGPPARAPPPPPRRAPAAPPGGPPTARRAAPPAPAVGRAPPSRPAPVAPPRRAPPRAAPPPPPIGRPAPTPRRESQG